MTYTPAHITRVKRETPTSVSLWIRPDDGGAMSFRGGQFFGLALPDPSVPGGWSTAARLYSVSGAPAESTTELRFTIKSMGVTSGHLCELQPGAPIGLRGPYGFFVLDESAPFHIMLAAGIGVTPFRSMIVGALAHQDNWRLIYSCTTRDEIVFRDEIDAGVWGSGTAITLTRESVSGMRSGRIDAELLATLWNAHQQTPSAWYVCGSVDFVNAMKDLLRGLGVSPEAIHSEKFV